jgi:hypothetical protein
MRFNLIFDFHKKPDWNCFYLEYKELKDYLLNARDFFNQSVKMEAKVNPNRVLFRRVSTIEENKEIEHYDGENINTENKVDLQKNPSFVTIEENKKFETKEQFSKEYIQKFDEKLNRVKNFFLDVKNDLERDLKVMKDLVLDREDIEVIKYI